MPTIKLRGKDVEIVGGWVSLWEHSQNEEAKRYLREHRLQVFFIEGKPFEVSCTDPEEEGLSSSSDQIDVEHRIIEKAVRELTGVYVECRNWDQGKGPGESINK